MRKRLQVVLDDLELREIQRIAKAQRLTVAEWVRQALRKERRQQPITDADRKLDSIRKAVRHEYPTSDIDQMLREIERGRSGPNSWRSCGVTRSRR